MKRKIKISIIALGYDQGMWTKVLQYLKGKTPVSTILRRWVITSSLQQITFEIENKKPLLIKYVLVTGNYTNKSEFDVCKGDIDTQRYTHDLKS